MFAGSNKVVNKSLYLNILSFEDFIQYIIQEQFTFLLNVLIRIILKQLLFKMYQWLTYPLASHW